MCLSGILVWRRRGLRGGGKEESASSHCVAAAKSFAQETMGVGIKMRSPGHLLDNIGLEERLLLRYELGKRVVDLDVVA